MTGHKYKIGQIVYLDAKKFYLPLGVPRGPYKVLKRLPAANGEFQSSEAQTAHMNTS